jgi:dihydrofolate synthase/folylpolyglutamate synthase
MKSYESLIEELYNRFPAFQQVGSGAYKPGLENAEALDAHFGHPHRTFRTIHVGGTNGKGSTSHTLAAILQESGYKVGLYTSPHLIDFRERMRVNGIPASEEYVIDFVEKHKSFFEPLQPSFFELTTAMAFNYFAEQQVDIAIIEVGLGGRLDCTNIITPELCIITNISLDHTQFLGSTLQEIASEKAGIIKSGIPVVIGETTPETKEVFANKAKECNAPITFAEEEALLTGATPLESGYKYDSRIFGEFCGELGGDYQQKNTNTLLSAIRILCDKGFGITGDSLRKGFENVCSLTGFMGRWQKIQDKPRVVCDAGHNIGGIKYITEQLARVDCKQLRIVFGMVNDKDITSVLKMMPKNAIYYFTQASIKRAMPADELKEMAKGYGLNGNSHPTVKQALEAAITESSNDDFIFAGGSCFIVADLLSALEK